MSPLSLSLLLIKISRIAVLKYCRTHILENASVICFVIVWCPSNIEEYLKNERKIALMADEEIEIMRAS